MILLGKRIVQGERMFFRFSTVACFVILMLSTHAALADKRVALLIGNSTYSAAGKLKNPVNDVVLIRATLEGAGFDKVQVAVDLSHDAMIKALRAFQDNATGAEVAVIYYSGHGMEMAGQNYLVPVDAKLASDRDVADETVSLDRVMRSLEGVSKLKLVVLDACRNNPFIPKMAVQGKSRALDRGLARVEPSGADTLVAFAAKAGTVASDGEGTNSPFAMALAKHLVEPGLDIRIGLGKVRDDVLSATHSEQEPFTYGSLGGEIIALLPTLVSPAPIIPKVEPQLPDTQPIAPTCANEQFLRSSEFSQKTGMSFTNKTSSTVNIYWLDYDGDRKLYASVRPNGKYNVSTFVTHPWIITDTANSCLRVYLPTASPQRIVIR